MNGAGTGELQEDRRTADQIERTVVRAVAADMSGGSPDQVYRALNGQLHASGLAPGPDEVWAYAVAISGGARPGDADLGSDG